MSIDRQESNTAVLALTAGGVVQAKKVAARMNASLFLPERFRPEKNVVEGFTDNIHYFCQFKETVTDLFNNYKALVFIMATGIVVRTIASLMESKYTDPAVVVMDEAGQFTISLISGHVGGANLLARRLAGLTGATPVITTATDVEGTPAVDILASQLNCVPFPRPMVKQFNRALAEGDPVRLSSRWTLPEEIIQQFNMASLKDDDLQVIVDRAPGKEEGPLYLLPRNLVIGIGCRRGVPGELIVDAVEKVLAGIPAGHQRVKSLATVDIKKDEEGIKYAAELYGVPVEIISRTDIEKLTGTFEESEFVKKTVGVGGVCEPAAMLACNQGRVVVPKRKMKAVTVAVAEEKLWWWDWGQETENV